MSLLLHFYPDAAEHREFGSSSGLDQQAMSVWFGKSLLSFFYNAMNVSEFLHYFQPMLNIFSNIFVTGAHTYIVMDLILIFGPCYFTDLEHVYAVLGF